jgi:hypothetical protein
MSSDTSSDRDAAKCVVAAIGKGFGAHCPPWYAYGHFVEERFGEQFDVPPAACSSVLMWRILHREETEGCRGSQGTLAGVIDLLQAEATQRGLEDGLLVQLETGLPESAATLVHAHCAATHVIPTDYSDLANHLDPPVDVSEQDLQNFARWLYREHEEELNDLAEEEFWNTQAVLDMLTFSPQDLPGYGCWHD